MNILVVGAQLANKGAESMLYVVVDEMKKRVSGCKVYFASIEEYDESKYCFERLYYTERGKKIALGGINALFVFYKAFIWDMAKFILGKRKNLWHYFDVKRIINNIDIVIDISGFNIGVKWDRKTHIRYINNIRLAQKYNIPMYIMPQSFGPFEYASNMKKIKRKLGKILQYPKIVYAREYDGYRQLIDTFRLKNVDISTDIVLQNKGIDWRNVFTSEPVINVPKVKSKRCVGIVPNEQCFNHGDKEKNLNIYEAVIKQLLEDGFTIVIFRHSRNDLEVCKMIKSMFFTVKEVVLEEREFSCLEYDRYVTQFCFIVGSRFHGLVHAYKNNVPCLALGWAVKYEELVTCVGQTGYAFDITSDCDLLEKILYALYKIENQYKYEREIIREKIKDIQKDNCFNIISIY